ncbi:MAG: hypothetical protein GX795_00025 [Firmicutes bacterium]|jgi:hypothetical protein|nr:hypothetical protein [Bacillota bacterium]
MLALKPGHGYAFNELTLQNEVSQYHRNYATIESAVCRFRSLWFTLSAFSWQIKSPVYLQKTGITWDRPKNTYCRPTGSINVVDVILGEEEERLLSDGRNPKQGSFAQLCTSRRLPGNPLQLILIPLMISLFLNLAGTTASKCHAAGSIVETPEEIHERAWRQAAESAVRASDFQKYAIYSSRSLAVANPEVYLQADEAWMKMMYDYGGWGANYLARDRKLTRETGWYEQVFYKINDGLRSTESDLPKEAFDWKGFRWTEHRRNAMDLFDLYEGAPVFSVLDHRLMFVWSAMKGMKWQMPYTSMAEAKYLEMVSQGKKAYLLITHDRKGFVAEAPLFGRPKLYDALTDSVVEEIGSDVLLVMNSKCVWYPLMERDDTGRDSRLKKVVDTYCSLSSVPRLDAVEAAILSDLAEGTKLATGDDFAAATIVAMRIVNQFTWRVKPLVDISEKVFIQQYKEGHQFGDSPYEQVCIGIVVTEMGNRLCPITSVWASDVQANAFNPRTAFERLGSAYHERFHRTDHHSEWVYGDYYRCWLPNLDDKLLSCFGDCAVEANNTMSVLTLADVSDWGVFEVNWWRIGGGGGHVVCGAYTPEGSFTLSNGLFDPGDCGLRGPLWDIDGRVAFVIIYEPKSGFITTAQTYNPKRFPMFETPYTNMNFEETVAFLEKIELLEKNISFVIDSPMHKSLSEYIKYIASNRDKWEKNMTKWNW